MKKLEHTHLDMESPAGIKCSVVGCSSPASDCSADDYLNKLQEVRTNRQPVKLEAAYEQVDRMQNAKAEPLRTNE